MKHLREQFIRTIIILPIFIIYLLIKPQFLDKLLYDVLILFIVILPISNRIYWLFFGILPIDIFYNYKQDGFQIYTLKYRLYPSSADHFIFIALKESEDILKSNNENDDFELNLDNVNFFKLIIMRHISKKTLLNAIINQKTFPLKLLSSRLMRL